MTYTLWNKRDPILFPFCKLDAQGVLEHYPWAEESDAVMEVSGGVCMGFSALATMLATYGLDEALTGQEALDAIAQAAAAQQEAEQAREAEAAKPLATQDDVLAIMEGIATLYELNAGGEI